MAEHSRFFDSIDPLDPDKVYTAEDFVKYLGGVVTGGIVKGEGNNLKVETPGSNMNVTVDTGMAYLVDRQYENDSKLSLTHEIEALGKSRIDRVVLRLVLDMDARYIKAFVKKGVAGVAPVAPPLTRTANVYEISLAQVKVIGGQTYINSADVTDERGNPDVCPWAGSKILPNFNQETMAEHVVDYTMHQFFIEATQDTNTTYNLSIPGVTEYQMGLRISLKPGEDSKQGVVRFNVNGLGIKEARYQTYNGLIQNVGALENNKVYEFIYNGTNFNLVGMPFISDAINVPFSNTVASSKSVHDVNKKLDSYILTGYGTPEGSRSAPPGTLHLSTQGGNSTTLYVKISGTGNTGWGKVTATYP